MLFNRELDFEKALIDLLITNYGWEKEVLEYKNRRRTNTELGGYII